MKKIIILLSILFFYFNSEASQPKLILNVYYSEPTDTTFLNNIRKSKDACCMYEIITIKSSSNKIEVCTQSNSLGTIYGYPTEKFLIDIYNRFYKKN